MDSLSEEVLKGLEVIAEEKLVPLETFKKLVNATTAILLHDLPPTDFSQTVGSGSDPIIIKQGHAAITALFLEGAKLNADPSVLSGVLEEHKIVQARQEHLIAKYTEAKPQLRKLLSQTLFHPPKIVDVDWRLDYFLKANSVEKINIPLYRIVLQTTNKDGVTAPVEFACTLEQLQDLVAKLRDATKQIDRSSGRA